MAFKESTVIPNDTPTLISGTSAIVGDCRVQNLGNVTIKLMVSSSATLLTTDDFTHGEFELAPGEPLENLVKPFPGVASRDFLHALCNSLDGKVSVCHG